MKIKNVRNFSDALSSAASLVPSKKNLNICLTGGNFGEGFLDHLIEEKIISNEWEIFLSDERLLPESGENLYLIYKERLQASIYQFTTNLNYFVTKVDPKDSGTKISERINTKEITNFDITFLSLGEDGHLAGHFQNSLNLSDMFCYTENAPKPPPARISFRLDWLKKSSILVIMALGSQKRRAFIDLCNGSSHHSSLVDLDNVIIITDIDIRNAH